MADPIPGTPANTPSSQPVAGNGAGRPAQVPPVGPGAKDTAPRFGGFRGGKRREDGLVPGSPEAAEADRKKDRLRKKAERKQPDPPPLPGITRPAVEGSPSTPGGGLGTLPGTPVQPVLPWDASTVQPIVEQFLPAAEQLMSNQISSRARKARLPAEIVKEIEADAQWPADAKKALQLNTANVTAKWLNKLGVSAEYGPEIAFMTALSRIAGGHVLVLRRLDKLIALANVQPAKPGEKGMAAPAAKQ